MAQFVIDMEQHYIIHNTHHTHYPLDMDINTHTCSRDVMAGAQLSVLSDSVSI